MTSCLLACLLLAYLQFFSAYKAHSNAFFCIRSLNPTPFLNLTSTLLTINNKDFYVIVKSQSPLGENEWDFYFWYLDYKQVTLSKYSKIKYNKIFFAMSYNQA